MIFTMLTHIYRDCLINNFQFVGSLNLELKFLKDRYVKK